VDVASVVLGRVEEPMGVDAVRPAVVVVVVLEVDEDGVTDGGSKDGPGDAGIGAESLLPGSGVSQLGL
jgi:hypothetical protein